MSSFLLVSLNIDAILSELTLHQRRKKLDEMIKGDSLGDAYTATLSRVQAQPKSRSKLGMQVLGGVWPATDSDLRLGLGSLKSDFGNLNQAGLRSRFKDYDILNTL